MKKYYLILNLFSLLFMVNCSAMNKMEGHSRNNYGTMAGIEKDNSIDIINDSLPKEDSSAQVYYNLIVSFSSNGNGINGQALKDFLDYIHIFEKFERTSVTFEIVPWGKEGEVDYCFKMEELYATQQERFKDGLNKILKRKKRVTLSENKACIHKKQPLLIK